jgi:hypothetical protein
MPMGRESAAVRGSSRGLGERSGVRGEAPRDSPYGRKQPAPALSPLTPLPQRPQGETGTKPSSSPRPCGPCGGGFGWGQSSTPFERRPPHPDPPPQGGEGEYLRPSPQGGREEVCDPPPLAPWGRGSGVEGESEQKPAPTTHVARIILNNEFARSQCPPNLRRIA